MSGAMEEWKKTILKNEIKRIKSVNDKISNFNNKIQKLNNLLNENIKINDIVAFKEYSNEASNEMNNISKSITREIIPGLNNAIK